MRRQAVADPLTTPSERDIQRAILDYLRLSGIPAWPSHSSRYLPASPGVSDILGVLPDGRFLAIEVKGPHGRLSEDQECFLSAVNASGGLGFVAYSVDEVQETLS